MRSALSVLFLTFLFTLSFDVRADFRIDSIDNDYPGEIEAAREESKRLVLFFHQPGCPYCDKMRNRVHPNSKVRAYFDKHFVMIESNIKGNLDVIMPDGTASNEVKFGRKMRVRATPVFVFYDLEGKQALKTVGFLDVDRFLQAGQYVVDGVHKSKKSFFKYVQENQMK